MSILSRHIASGVMLTGLLVAFGFAWLQPGDSAQSIDVDVVTAPEVEETASVERPATPADRVVDEAGFPSIADAEPLGVEENPGPVVTINGRPIGERSPSQVAATTPAQATTSSPARDQTTSTPTASQPAPTAVVAPPLPQPRPEGLQAPRATASAPTQQPQTQRVNPGTIDYDAIAAAAYGNDESQFMTPQERQSLAPMPGVADFDPQQPAFDPRSQGLVEIVDASGERIWVYEDQIRSGDSRVTIDNRRETDEFGFIYDNERPIW